MPEHASSDHVPRPDDPDHVVPGEELATASRATAAAVPTPTTGYVLAPDEGVDERGAEVRCSNASTGGSLAMYRTVVDGQGPPRHEHVHEDETIVVLDGTMEVDCGDDTWRGSGRSPRTRWISPSKSSWLPPPTPPNTPASSARSSSIIPHPGRVVHGPCDRRGCDTGSMAPDPTPAATPDFGLPDDPAWLVVDVMNVVGSRPDGWWRDRVGAAARLVARLRILATTTGRPIMAVVDGDPSERLPDDTQDGVEVMHGGRGRDAADDRIVEVLAARGQSALVVTADRDLRARVRDLGADVVGPSALLARLDAVHEPDATDPT